MPFIYDFPFDFGVDPISDLSVEDVIDLFIQLWPKGRLYDWYNPSSEIYKLFAGIADSLLPYCYDMIARLRAEINPATAGEKLPDYEAALGISGTLTARSGTSAQRQQAVVSKFRESGGFTPHNVQAILGPLLGYADPSQLVVYEVERSALTALHTYSSTLFANTIPDNDPAGLAWSIYVPDAGEVSNAGAQLTVNITHTNIEQLTVTLTAPDNVTIKRWTLGGTGSVTAANFVLGSEIFAALPISGSWIASVIDGAAGGTGTLNTYGLFVEGIAQGQNTGGAIFEWGAYADPSLVTNPDYPSAQLAIERMKHAHTLGDLLLSVSPWPDVVSGAHAAIPNMCLPV